VKNISQAASDAGGLVFLKKSMPTADFRLQIIAYGKTFSAWISSLRTF
jgi:hypothetical protein